MMIEVLILTLKPATRDQFHQLYVRESLPLQKKWGIDVVAHGPSHHDLDTYFVVRKFKSLEYRQSMEDSFYGSNDWQNGPRTEILSMIDHLATLVLPEEAIKEWLP